MPAQIVRPAISHSRVERYLLCRRMDWYGYQFPTEQGHGIRRQSEHGSLGLGTAFHRVAASFYEAVQAGSPREVCKDLAWDEYRSIMAEGFEDRGGRFETLERVVEIFLDNEALSLEYEILGVEMEFNLTTDEGEFPFIVDLLVRGRDGLIYVVDHKTSYYLFDEEQTDLMPQIPKYVGALRALGYKVAAGKYQVVRTQHINGKSMLKDDLAQTLVDAGIEIPPKATVAILQSLADTHGIQHTQPVPAAQVFQVLPVEPSLDRVMETMREQFEAAVELRERDAWSQDQQEARAWRTANKTVCKSCDFRLLCSEELRGGNSNLVLLHEYEPKPKRDSIEESEEVDSDD